MFLVPRAGKKGKRRGEPGQQPERYFSAENRFYGRSRRCRGSGRQGVVISTWDRLAHPALVPFLRVSVFFHPPPPSLPPPPLLITRLLSFRRIGTYLEFRSRPPHTQIDRFGRALFEETTCGSVFPTARRLLSRRERKRVIKPMSYNIIDGNMRERAGANVRYKALQTNALPTYH